MLDMAVRRLDGVAGEVSAARGAFREEDLLRIGDDAFVDMVAALEVRQLDRQDPGLAPPERPVMPELLARRLYREVWRIDRHGEVPAAAADMAARALDPAVRTAVEARILEEVPELAAGDIIFASRPLTMQRKQPDILIGWTRGSLRTITEIAESEDYGREALEIAARYGDLWSMSVYLRPDRMAAADAVRAACAHVLAPAAEPVYSGV
jgi:hypothetical protein